MKKKIILFINIILIGYASDYEFLEQNNTFRGKKLLQVALKLDTEEKEKLMKAKKERFDSIQKKLTIERKKYREEDKDFQQACQNTIQELTQENELNSTGVLKACYTGSRYEICNEQSSNNNLNQSNNILSLSVPINSDLTNNIMKKEVFGKYYNKTMRRKLKQKEATVKIILEELSTTKLEEKPEKLDNIDNFSSIEKIETMPNKNKTETLPENNKFGEVGKNNFMKNNDTSREIISESNKKEVVFSEEAIRLANLKFLELSHPNYKSKSLVTKKMMKQLNKLDPITKYVTFLPPQYSSSMANKPKQEPPLY
jgi:hypothetical protein